MSVKLIPGFSRWEHHSNRVVNGCDHALARWKRTKNFFTTESDGPVDQVTTKDGGTEGTQPLVLQGVGEQHKEVHNGRTDEWTKGLYTEGEHKE